jgi:hypothetical protein
LVIEAAGTSALIFVALALILVVFPAIVAAASAPIPG